MRTEKIEGHNRVIIDPGEYYASNIPVTISTLLGSCVSACLFDPVNKVMGMNHFMLSQQRYAQNLIMTQSEAGRYGIHSMELLINEILRLGAAKHLLKAKAFGGSTLIGNRGHEDEKFLSVGSVNSQFVRDFRALERIPLLAENLGGNVGRVIHFSYGDFAVYMRKIKNLDRSNLIPIRDRKCWQHAITEHQIIENNIELWG